MAVASSGRPRGAAGAVARVTFYALSVARTNSANAFTLGRLLAIGPILLCFYHQRYDTAFWLFAAAAATDLIDGLIAKHFAGRSPLGAWLDPLADKALLTSLLVALAATGHLPVWFVALALARDVAIGLGAVTLYLRLSGYRVEPLMVGKLCTFLQVLLTGAALGAASAVPALGFLVPSLLHVTVAVTLLSGTAYLLAALRLTRRDAALS